MYKFRDTKECMNDDTILPAEAVNFNGEQLDEVVPYFRTLNTTGRELIGADVDNYSMGAKIGKSFRNRQIGARTIDVTFQIIAPSNEDYREAYNKLNYYLQAEEARLIFADEPDKYFIATMSDVSAPDAGVNSGTGSISFICSDPRKYSLTQKSVKAVKQSDGVIRATINNHGTLPAILDYDIKFNSDNGYLLIQSDSGKMEFGTREEADVEKYEVNEVLATMSSFKSASDDTEGTDYYKPDYGVNGTLKEYTWYGSTYLGFESTGTQKGTASGGLRTITLPADSEGVVGAEDWYAYMHVFMYAGLMGQTGEMNINFLDADNKVIAGLNWYKADKVGNYGVYEFVANGKGIKTMTFQCDHTSENPWWYTMGHCDIKKVGSKITFYWRSQYYTYDIPEIAGRPCVKIQYSVKAREDRTTVGSNFLNNLGMNIFSFYKYNVEKTSNLKNRYTSGDELHISGSDAKMTVNGQPKFSDEIVGTEYFKLPAGQSEIEFYLSSWATEPEIEISYTEVYL